MINKFNIKFFNRFCYNFKSFSSIRLVTKAGTVDRSANPNFNPNINWELAKVWINPHNNSFLNAIDAKSVNISNEENENCKVVGIGGTIQQIEFDRFLRKMGLNISRADNVFVQDGLFKGRKLRVVSPTKEEAAFASKLFEEKSDFLTADYNVLYLTKEIGVDKRFVFYDAKKKIIISNTRNTNNIALAIENIEKAESQTPAK